MACAAVAAALAALAAVAIASGGGPPGTVDACKQKNNGQVRIVSDPSECRPSEEYQALASGGSGSLDAYARVENGTLDATRSKNVVSMTQTTYLFPGGDPDDVVYLYCFDLTFVPANALATVDMRPTAPEWTSESAVATVAGTAAMASINCPPGTDAAVGGHEVLAGSNLDDFYARFTA